MSDLGSGYQELLEEIRVLAAGETDRDALLAAVCETLFREVPHYDWVGVYLVSESEERMLVLGPYRGEPTEHVRIPFGSGICGRAASLGRTVVAGDVDREPDYLACSIEVRSELVVPISRGAEVLGEIDIDSHSPDAFSDSDRLN